jgi:hypothetical protein
VNWRRIALCALLVLVTKAVVGALMFGLLFADVLGGGSAAFRAEGTEHHGAAMLGYVAWAIAFSLIFSRAFEQRGWLDGVRFALLVWLLYFLPMTLGIYGYFVVDGRWTAFALLSGLAESLACGSAAALVLRTRPTINQATARAGTPPSRRPEA